MTLLAALYAAISLLVYTGVAYYLNIDEDYMASPVTEVERTGMTCPRKSANTLLLTRLARARTGIVYLSHDPYYRRDVAIKVYNIEEDADADNVRRCLSKDVFQ